MPIFARAQFLAGSDGIDPATRAITPTAATSLLTAVLSERSGTGNTPHTVSDNGATGVDWVKAFGWDQQLANSSARHSFSLWWKVAGSTAAITVSGDDGTGNGKRLTVHEYTTDTAGTWSVVSGAAVGADTGTGSSSPLAIGPTGSAPAGDNLVQLSINWRTAGDQAYPGAATGGFTGLTSSGSGSDGRQHGTAWQQDAAGGTFSTSVDWTGTGHEAAGAIVVFALDGGGGPTTHDLAADAQAQALATAALTGGTGPATEDVSITALDFAVNNAAGSDARLMFVGSNLPPRTEFTISGSVYWKAQTDYTGLIAFFSDLGSGNWSGGAWEALFCPHNNDGTYDADGDFLAGSPTLRHFEIGGRKRDADSVSRDTISSPASPGPQGSLITTANEWTVFIFRCTQVGSDLIYTLQPDIRNHPDFKIVSPSVAADIGSTPATPAFSIGAFKWSGNGSTNPEAPGARVRGLRIIGAHADDADALAEALAGERGTNAWETSFGAANGWYINDNPTVADITDKSGAGHTPVWDNAQRPADYSGTLTVPAVGVAVDMAAAGTAQATATATLLKGVSLSGAGLAVAGGSASMSHVVPLAASAVAAAVAGGQLALAVQLSGAAIASAAASAGMSLAVPLAADGAAQAGASAELSTNASVDLAANAQAAASASAVLSLTVSLSAAAVGQALASAALAKAVALGADGAAQADGAAGLQVGAGTDLAADAAAQASAGASLWLDVPLGADALAQALAGGSLSLAVLLGADALSSASGSAAMAADVQLSADGQVIAMATAGLQVTGPISSYLKGFLARPPERTWTAVPPERSFTARPPARI
jgi:hypothetical protein